MLDRVEELLMNSPDDFGITLSGNPLTAAHVKEIHSKIEKLHKRRVQEQAKSDPNAILIEDIAQKRLAF